MRKRRKVNLKKQVASPKENACTDPPADPCETSKTPRDLQATAQRKILISLNYNRNLLKYLNDDRERQGSFCDLVVVVEGKEFRVHKVVVAVGSCYFYACLSKNPNTEVVTLEHVSSSVFQHLLKFLYTSEFLILDNEISVVLEAAKFLDIIDAVRLLEAEHESVSLTENSPLLSPPEPPSSTPEPPSSPPEPPSSPPEPPGTEEPVSDLENGHHGNLSGQDFSYENALENHMDQVHQIAETDVLKDSDTSTMTSTGQAECPLSENLEALEINSTSSSELDESSQHETDSEDSSNESSDVGNLVVDNDQPVAGEEEVPVSDGAINDKNNGEGGDKNETCSALGKFPDGLAPVVLEKDGKNLKCPKCSKVFDKLAKYERHIHVHLSEKPFECDICKLTYTTKSNLTAHRKRHSLGLVIRKEHGCPFCNKLHASRMTLVKHVETFHADNAKEFLTIKEVKEDGWKCQICNKSFTRQPHLKEHMILHSQETPFKCTYCDEQFKSRFKRMKHEDKYHLGPFPCGICNHEFNDSGNLKRHLEYTHGGIRKWTCIICGKSVRERTTLKEHMRIHSGEKPHLCSICGQSFRHVSSFRLHIRVHHEEKRYECDECGKKFGRHDHLTKHQKIHSGEKAHQCEECGKCFGRRDHLAVHYKSVHQGEKVWQKYKVTLHKCDICKKVFTRKSNFDMHSRTHTGEKPYKCHICSQAFCIKKTLTKHLVIHSDVRPFTCPHCKTTFKRKDKLKYHIDHVHNSDSEEMGAHTKKRRLQKSVQTSETAICVPLTLVSVEITQTEEELEASAEATGLQRPTELAFLEKYTLTPQPATILHPVQPEQTTETREISLIEVDPQQTDLSSKHD